MQSLGKRSRYASYLYVIPGMFLILFFLAYPVFQGFLYSLYRYNLASASSMHFIGLSNYARLISDPAFMQALGQTIIFVVFALLFEFVLGFFFAMLLTQDFFGKIILRGLILLPWMMPQTVTAFMWSWILNGTNGVLNSVLLDLGLISSNIQWLSTEGLTLGVIIFIDIWSFTPFVTLVLYAGMQGIPADLYEAAIIDGCNSLKRIIHVTIPCLKSAASVAFLMRAMMAMRTFDTVWTITRGGPAGSTELLGTYAYKKGMVGFNIGMGSASSTVIFILSLAVSVWFIGSVLKKK